LNDIERGNYFIKPMTYDNMVYRGQAPLLLFPQKDVSTILVFNNLNSHYFSAVSGMLSTLLFIPSKSGEMQSVYFRNFRRKALK